MKIVTLAAPAVDDTGAVRYPIEGSLTVTADLAKRWKDAGCLAKDPEDVPAAEEAEDPKPAPRRTAKEA